MKKLSQRDLEKFIGKQIIVFHEARLQRMRDVNLSDVLRKKNPYLFRAKNMQTTDELIGSILDAFASSSEEELFGDFLEELAIYIASRCSGGRKSSTAGIDIELDRDEVRYLVAVKSGPNWGNSSQYDALKTHFQRAVKVVRQSKSVKHAQPVLGICYGRNRTADNGLYLKITGQNFWYFLSENESLYADLIEPIGREAREHCDRYKEERDKLCNRLAKQFLDEFSLTDGAIHWQKLLEFNSGNTVGGKWS